MNKIMYGTDGQERLDEDSYDVMQGMLEMMLPGEYPDAVEVFEFERRRVYIDSENMLEYVYERLDEEYGDPDSDDYTKPSEAVNAKAQELAELIMSEYESWLCDKNGNSEVIDVRKWLVENDMWLDDPDVVKFIEGSKV